jgi:surfactin synthase thioesterase subunit
LFCIPFAGGSATVYNTWREHMRENIELLPIELAGRGSRWNRPLYPTFDDAVADVYEAIRRLVDDLPYALFGHSMGSWIAYELAHRLSAEGHRPPAHLFLSGRRAPTAPYAGPILHTLPEAEFVEALVGLGGVSRELFDDPELRAIFLGIIRADLKITETYQYVDRGRLLDVPATVLNGKSDSTIAVRDLFPWRSLFSGPCSICAMEGGHFFVTQNVGAVTRVINQTLERYFSSVAG